MKVSVEDKVETKANGGYVISWVSYCSYCVLNFMTVTATDSKMLGMMRRMC